MCRLSGQKQAVLYKHNHRVSRKNETIFNYCIYIYKKIKTYRKVIFSGATISIAIKTAHTDFFLLRIIF